MRPADDLRKKEEHPARARVVQAAVVLSICSLAAVFYGSTQDLIAYGNGYPYDAGDYVRMATQFAGGQTISAQSPFVYRIGLPFLVGVFFPASPLAGFRILNIIFAAATLAVLYLHLLKFTRSTLVLTVILLLFVANPIAPFRFTHLYPGLTDPPALLLMLLILFIDRQWPGPGIAKTCVLAALGLAGALVREIAIVSALSIVCAAGVAWWTSHHDNRAPCRRALLLSFIPLAAALIGLVIARLLVVPDGAFPLGPLDIIKRNLHNPSLVMLSAFVSFGPVLMLLLLQWKLAWQQLRKHVDMLAYLVIILMLSLVGGTHTDRFMYWAFPVALPMLAVAIEQAARLRRSVYAMLLFFSLAAAQLLAFNAFGSLPSKPFDPTPPFEDLSKQQNPSFLLFAPYGNTSTAHVSAAFVKYRVRIILLGEYLLLLACALLLWRQALRADDRARTAQPLPEAPLAAPAADPERS